MNYFTAVDVAEWLAVSRQTLRYWRQERKILVGHRFRNRHVVFTSAKVKETGGLPAGLTPEPPTDPQPDLYQGA